MAAPNIPAGFDFLDPDVNLGGLPVDGARRTAQDRADPLGGHPRRCRRLRGQRLLDRHQACRCQGGVAPQRRLLQLAERRHPDVAAGDEARAGRTAAQRHAQHGRAASHPAAQDHLPRVHAARHRPAGGGARQRAQNIAKTAAADGVGDFVEQVSCELPLQAIAGLLGVPQEDRDKLFRWSNEMTGGYRSRVRRRRSRAVVDGTDHVRDGDGRRAGQEPDRRHRHDVDRGRHRRREALRRRVRLLRHHAGGGGQRDHPQLDHSRHDRLREQPGPMGAVQEGAPGRPRPTRSSAGPPRCRRSSAPPTRTPSCPACRSRRASGW